MTDQANQWHLDKRVPIALILGMAAQFATLAPKGTTALDADYQAKDANLTSLSGLTLAANKGLYSTAADTLALFDLTAAGRALLGDADAAAQRVTLGVPDVIDEDDFATDSATRPPSQQSTKAYVDAEVAAAGWQYAAAQATTSGTEFDFPSIPATANEIFIGFDKPSLTGGDDLLIQIGDSGGIEATGYVSSSERQTGNGQGTSSSTAGFIARIASSSTAISGAMRLQRGDGNTWHETHSAALSDGAIINGGGAKTLSATLDRVRITRHGTDTFDAGSVIVGWRT